MLSLAIIVTAAFTLFQGAIAARLRPAASRVVEHEGPVLGPLLQRGLTVAAGALIGSVVTVSSVGAGVIGMMLLLLLYPKHPPVKIVGSDLAHAVLITAIAGIGHARLLGLVPELWVGDFDSVDYLMLGWLLLGALPGIWLGSRVGFRLDGAVLKRVVAVLLLVVGSMTLYKTL